MIHKNYDTKKYNFTSIVENMFKTKDLTNIHTTYKNDYERFDVDSDQSTIYHKIFYEKMNEDFIPLYEDFISNVILSDYECSILFQKSPTFRISLPGNVAVGGYHKDSDYNHNSKEVNYFLPLTDAYDTNTLWYESSPGTGTYIPMNAKKGEYFIWDGANTMHGNKENKTGRCRISVDFRVIKYDDYNKESIKSSITNFLKFDIGNYWSLVEKN